MTGNGYLAMNSAIDALWFAFVFFWILLPPTLLFTKIVVGFTAAVWVVIAILRFQIALKEGL